MTWIIVGGGGYIGSHVVQELLSHGFSPLIFDNFSRGNLNLAKEHSRIFIGDITNEEDLENVFNANQIEGVINLAAVKSVSESLLKPQKYEFINTIGTKLLLEFSIKHSVPFFIQSSSGRGFSNGAYFHLWENQT